jgi:hypothetical protein
MLTTKELKDLELYPKFKETIYRIGGTRYKLVEFSVMLAGVYIKHDHEGRKHFRQIADFFGEDSHTQAIRFVQDRLNN